jgi:hypothetical protein
MSCCFVQEQNSQLPWGSGAWLEYGAQMLVLATWFASVQFNGKQGEGAGLRHR